jgi:hypothetical protein
MKRLIALVAVLATFMLVSSAPIAAVEARDLQVGLKLGCVLLPTYTEPSPGYQVFDGGQRAYIQFQLTITNNYDEVVRTSVAGGYGTRIREQESVNIIIPERVQAVSVATGHVFRLMVDAVWDDGPTDATEVTATYDGGCKDVPPPAKTVSTAAAAAAASAPAAAARFTG